MANPLVAIFNPITTLIDQIPSVSSGPAAPGIPIVTNILGVIDSSLLGVGSQALAGETISSGQLVNLYSSAGSLHAQVASAKNSGTAPSGDPYPVQAQGFANSNAVLGGSLTVNFSGTFKYIDGNSEFSGSNIGQEVYLSASTPGGITLNPNSFIAGTVFVGTLQAGETITQAISGATARFVSTTAGGILVSNITGSPTSSNIW